MGTATGQAPYQQTVEVVVPAVTIAATDDTPIGRAPFTGVVASVVYVADTAITGANTNTRKVSLVNKGQAGSGTTEVAAKQFNSGTNAVAFDETTVTLSGTAANLNVVAGDILSWKSEAVGTGMVDPGGMVIITLTRD